MSASPETDALVCTLPGPPDRFRIRVLLEGSSQTCTPPQLVAHFVDYLTPAVLLSMNTGLRRGEVLKLRWSSIDFTRRLLTLDGPKGEELPDPSRA